MLQQPNSFYLTVDMEIKLGKEKLNIWLKHLYTGQEYLTIKLKCFNARIKNIFLKPDHNLLLKRSISFTINDFLLHNIYKHFDPRLLIPLRHSKGSRCINRLR